MSFWQNPAVVGLILAIPATFLGYLGYRRSRAIDEVAEQAGIATTHATSIGQVVDGLNKIIANLQEDNQTVRGEVVSLRQIVEEIRARLDVVESGSTDLRAKNRELERENAALHGEIDELRAENKDLKARIVELEKKGDHA